MSTKGILILDQQNIRNKIIRIAYQILEDNFEEESLVLVGVADRGFVFASRLKAIIEEISHLRIELIKLMLDKESKTPDVQTDIPIDQAKNKTVILVDDVLSSGRTLAYGIGLFVDVPLKKIRTAVLIDRSHRKFPVLSDFAGLKLSTTLKERIAVTLKECDGEDDAAWLL